MAKQPSKPSSRFPQDPLTITQADIKKLRCLWCDLFRASLKERREALSRFGTLQKALIVALASGCPVEPGRYTLGLRRCSPNPETGDLELTMHRQRS